MIGGDLYIDITVDAPPVTVAVDGDIVVDVIMGSGPISYPQLPAAVQQVPLSFPVAGRPPSGNAVYVPMPWALSIPDGLTGAVVYADTPPTDDAAFVVNRISGGVAVELGTITIEAGSQTACALAGSGGALVVGDVLQLVAPLTPDATLADLGITILAARV